MAEEIKEEYVNRNLVFMGLRYYNEKPIMLWISSDQYEVYLDTLVSEATIERAASPFNWDKKVPPLVIGGSYEVPAIYDEETKKITGMKLSFTRTQGPLYRNDHTQAWNAKQIV